MAMSSSPVNLQIPVKQNPPTEPRNNTSQLHTTMISPDVFQDSASSVRIISTCTAKRDLKLGTCVHTKMLKSGLDTNVFVANSLLDMYAKSGKIDHAAYMFEQMPHKTIVSWTSIISGYCQNGAVDEAISTFRNMLDNVDPNEYTLAALLRACVQKCDLKLVEAIHCYIAKRGFLGDDFLCNSLIDAYAKSAALDAAEKLVKNLSCRDVVSWTSIISGSVLNGRKTEALNFFAKMQEDGVVPNLVTILSVLQACSLVNELLIFRWIHGLVLKAGWLSEVLVMNSMVEMYSINGYFQQGMKLFCECCFMGEVQYLTPETMATLLQGSGHSGYINMGKQIHGYVIKHGFLPCTIIENSLIDMYTENEQSDSAFELFVTMNSRDIVSWNTIIRCFVKNKDPYVALKLLGELHCNQSCTLSPDFITMLSSIQACSNLASLQLGQVIHGYTLRTGLVCDTFVQNALIDMYAKSGRLDLMEQVFEEMLIRDLGTWNPMIAGYGINGNGKSALRVFMELKELEIHQLNAITYVNVLSACAHSGLVEEGFEIFNQMKRENSIEQSMEHFVCMVDLLGRSGRLEEANAFIEKMPIRPGSAVWGALLGACGLHGNTKIAEKAAKRLSVLEPESNVWRVALSNVYANASRWEDAAKIRAEMRGSEELRKEGGWSSIEVRGDMFKFMVGDTKHPESEMIYKVLIGIRRHIEAVVMSPNADRVQTQHLRRADYI